MSNQETDADEGALEETTGSLSETEPAEAPAPVQQPEPPHRTSSGKHRAAHKMRSLRAACMAFLSFTAWVLTACTLIALLYIYTPIARQRFAMLEMELSLPTVGLLAVGKFLHNPSGMLIAIGVAVFSVQPFLLYPKDRAAARWYAAAAFAGMIAIGLVWLAVIRPAVLIDHMIGQQGAAYPPK